MLGNKNRMLLHSLKTFVTRGVRGKLQKVIQKAHPADLGLTLGHLPPAMALAVLEAIEEPAKKAQVLSEADPELAAELIVQLAPEEIAALLSEMYSDDSAQILENIDDELREQIIRQMRQAESEEVQERFDYLDETAGRIMVPDFLALSPETTVAEAITALREGADVELVYYIYVVNEAGKLDGVVSLRRLLLVDPSTPLLAVMVPDVITVRVDEDQEEVANRVERYNLVAIPVVDDVGKMLGVITVDDVIDIIKEEATEDILRLAGTGEEDPLLSGSVLRSFRARWPWLLASCFGGMFAFLATHWFEDLLSRVVLLAGLIPVVMGMGGNVGTQTSTLVVRGLAIRRLDASQLLRVMFRELQVGGLLGLAYAGLVGVLVVAFEATAGLGNLGTGVLRLATVAGLGILSSMLVATGIGTAIPLLLDRMKLDPAVATGPIVTVSIDVCAVLSYFGIARLLLSF